MLIPRTQIRERPLAWLVALLAALSLAIAHGSALAQSRPAYTQAELDRMLAPIALYPDPLLSQLLMAATYPIEVVEAARWSRANPGLQGDAAVRTVEDKNWDPSVKSLVAFPNVLARMDENLEWTRELGDAFLTQEPQVMETVQQLRQRARAAGTLVPDERIRVVEDGRTIVIAPADPRVIYVPYYDPWVAYGSWWWPAYPPVVWAPWPGYVVHPRHPRPGLAMGFYWGPAVRISVGFFFGDLDWHRHQARVVNVNTYYYRPTIVRRDVHVHETVVVAPGRWQHDPWHRRGVAYRDPDVQRRFAPTAPPREFRREERHPEQRPAQRRTEPAVPRIEPPAPAVHAAPRPAANAEPVDRVEGRAERRNARPDERRQERRQEPRAPEAAAARTEPPAPVVRPAPRTERQVDRVLRTERGDERRHSVDRADSRPTAHAPVIRAQPSREASAEPPRRADKLRPGDARGDRPRQAPPDGKS